MLAFTPPRVWPSAPVDDVGAPVLFISQLSALPAGAPVNASYPTSRLGTHDSGSGWLATPFLCDFSIHCSTPVYPGAPTKHASLRWTHVGSRTGAVV
jgi:hypothetical protein